MTDFQKAAQAVQSIGFQLDLVGQKVRVTPAAWDPVSLDLIINMLDFPTCASNAYRKESSIYLFGFVSVTMWKKRGKNQRFPVLKVVLRPPPGVRVH